MAMGNWGDGKREVLLLDYQKNDRVKVGFTTMDGVIICLDCA